MQIEIHPIKLPETCSEDYQEKQEDTISILLNCMTIIEGRKSIILNKC